MSYISSQIIAILDLEDTLIIRGLDTIAILLNM